MIPENPLISVIMPVYNCEKYLKVAIDSVLNQTYLNIELLIADDKSTDSSKQIIDSYQDKRIKRFHNNSNLGYLKSCNLLAAKANGDLFTFLDADDINDNKRFEKLIRHLSQNPEIDCVGSNIIRIDASGIETSRSDFHYQSDQIKKTFENYGVPCHFSSLLIKKKVLDKVGLYNEYFDRIGSEDVYWFSFVIESFKVENHPDALYYYRKHSGSVTATHKNPKASVGNQLTLWLYKRRQQNKIDYIHSGQWKLADKCAEFFLATNLLSQSKFKSFLSFLKANIFSPIIGFQFFRYYVSHFKHAITVNKL